MSEPTTVRMGALAAYLTLAKFTVHMEDTVSGASATQPIWLCRADSITRALGGGAADQLAARGALGTDMARLPLDHGAPLLLYRRTRPTGQTP